MSIMMTAALVRGATVEKMAEIQQIHVNLLSELTRLRDQEKMS